MQEQRQVTFTAQNTLEMMGTDDTSGKKSKLAMSVDMDTEVNYILIGTSTAMTYQIWSGDRAVGQGVVGSGGTIGVFPSTNTIAPGSFVCLAGEEISVEISNATATPSAMLVIERE